MATPKIGVSKMDWRRKLHADIKEVVLVTLDAYNGSSMKIPDRERAVERYCKDAVTNLFPAVVNSMTSQLMHLIVDAVENKAEPVPPPSDPDTINVCIAIDPWKQKLLERALRAENYTFEVTPGASIAMINVVIPPDDVRKLHSFTRGVLKRARKEKPEKV